MKDLPGYLIIFSGNGFEEGTSGQSLGLGQRVILASWVRLGPKGMEGGDLFTIRFINQCFKFVSPFPDPWEKITNDRSISGVQWDSKFPSPPIALLEYVVLLFINHSQVHMS